MVRFFRIWLFCLLWGFAMAPAAWAVRVEAVADRDRIGAGESLQLELRLDGSPEADPDFSALEADWEILGRSQSSQMNIVNGRVDRTTVYRLTLMPRRSGSLAIPPVCFGADCSAAQTVEVHDAPAPDRNEPEDLVLEVSAAPQKVVAGAQVLLTVRLLHRVSLAGASLSDPKPEGVEAEVQPLGKDRGFETRRDGYRYAGIERRYVLFPQAEGRLTVPSMQLDARVASGRSSFDPFGRGLQPVRRRSEPVSIEVLPPAADAGARAWLPARRLTLADDWQGRPPTLRVGEPATRTLTVTVSGLPAAHLPDLAVVVPDGWKSYADQPLRQDGEDADGIVGTLQQKIALVPTGAGEFELPAVDLDWYDTAAGAWRRAHLDPVRVTVAPAPAAAAPAAQAAPQPAVQEPAAPGPAPVETAPPAGGTLPSSSGIWPWISLGLAAGWLLTGLLFWRRVRPKAPAPARAGAPDRSQLRRAQAAVREAAFRNDPAAARRALLQWSRCRWPEAGIHGLEALARRCGPPLAGAIEALNAALYGPSPASWQGAALAEAMERIGQPARQPSEALPPLYPPNVPA